MRRIPGLGAALLVCLVLTGCATGSPPIGSSTESSASNTPSATPVVVTGLVVGLDAIAVTNSDGSSGGTAPFSEGSAVLALLGRVLGSTPAPQRDATYLTTSYDWGGLSLMVNDDNVSLLHVRSAKIGDLAVTTAEGIRIGSTLAEVQAVASQGTGYSPPGTANTYYGLQARPHPGTESLSHPGEVGSDYIDVALTNGVVDGLIAPSGDWQDI